MRRTFIPLLQRKASAFSCQVLQEDFWIFRKAIYTLLFRRYSHSCQPFTQRNYLRRQILYVTPHQSVRVSFITVLGYDKRWTETQKSFCLFFFCVWWCPIFFLLWLNLHMQQPSSKNKHPSWKIRPWMPTLKICKRFFFFFQMSFRQLFPRSSFIRRSTV